MLWRILRQTHVRTTVLSCAAAALLAGPAAGVGRAQDAPPAAADERESAGFFAIGGSWASTSALDDRLQAAGYPALGRRMLTIGGGGYGARAGRLLLGGEGYGLWTGDEVHEGRTISLGGGYGLFNVGYVFGRTTRARAYPLLGIGGGGMTLRIGPRPSGDSFDDVLLNPDRHASLARGGMLVSVGAGVEYRVRPGGHGFLLGVRAGYLMPVVTETWRLDGVPIGGGPDLPIRGPFVRIVIGSSSR